DTEDGASGLSGACTLAGLDGFAGLGVKLIQGGKAGLDVGDATIRVDELIVDLANVGAKAFVLRQELLGFGLYILDVALAVVDQVALIFGELLGLVVIAAAAGGKDDQGDQQNG